MGRDTSETIVGEQMIKRLVDLNYPNVAEDQYPLFEFESVDENIIKTRAEIISMLSSAGIMDPNESWVRAFLTLPPKEITLIKGDEEVHRGLPN